MKCKRGNVRRFLSILLIFVLVLSLMPTNGLGLTVYAEETDTGLCAHHTEHTVNDGEAGGEDAQGCTEGCGYIAAQEEIPCDKGCEDTDGDGIIDHAEDCAYTPAVEGQPCQYECRICAVQELIDALPGAGEITTENAGDVADRLAEINGLLNALTDEETAQVDINRYTETAAALEELDQEQEESEEPEVIEEPEMLEVEHTYIPDAHALPDNNELFAGYVERTFYGAGDIAPLANYGESVLNETEKAIYNELKAAVQGIAAGTNSSTKITITSNLGIESWITEKTGTDLQAEADEKLNAVIDTGKIIDCLLVDCPYELYWYDKTVGCGGGYSLGTSISGGITTASIHNLTFCFAVADAYAGGAEYTTNTTRTGAAAAAAANARQVVVNNADKSDYEKLTAYRDYICEQVSYNDEAIEDNYSGGYGDPWQLIYVFDGNSSTNVVCEGYSKAFQYLCDLSTFNNAVCYTVTGTMGGGTGEGAHMWNIVTLNGSNYLVDVTNSDTGTVGEGGGLFLAGTSGSVTRGYTFVIDAYNSVSYTYDSNATELYSADILTLAGENYTEQEEESKETTPECGTISSDTTWTSGTLSDGTLIVEPGVTLTITDKVTISGNVTIKGGGTILRGSKDGYFTVENDGNLTLDNITLEGASVVSSYPMIRVYYGTVTLDDGCRIQNCIKNPGTGGAALYMENGTAVLNDATIENCSSANNAGAILSRGNSRLTINGGTYRNNMTTVTPEESVTLAYGGGFICNGGGAKLYIYGGDFIGNTSAGRGGCIYNTGDSGTVTYLYGGYFQGNTSSCPGYEGSGAVFCSSVVAGSTIFNLSGNAQFCGDGVVGSGADGIYLDMRNSTPRKIQVSSSISSPVSIYLNASEGYVIAEGGDGYTLQKKDMKQMSFFDSAGKTWYAWLDENNNQIYLSATPPPYGLFVYYVSNGAQGTVEDNTEYQSGDVVTVKPAEGLIREGYVFVEWNTKVDGTGTSYHPEDKITMTADLTLYAIWSRDTASYRVEHYQQDVTGDGYTKVDSDTEELTGVIGNTVTAEAKTYPGFTENTFHAARKASGTVEESGTLVLKLYYDRDTYEIGFDLNGADGTTPAKQTVRYGGSLQEVDAPLKKGYTFKGWYTDAEGTDGNQWNFDKTVEENTTSRSVTLYAKWVDDIAPVLGEVSFNTGHKNFLEWIIRKKALIITVPITEEGSGVKQVEYTLTPEKGTPVVMTAQTRKESGENETKTGQTVADIVIENDFKGAVALICIDNAGNISAGKTVTASGGGVIVEDNAPEISFSSVNGDLSNWFSGTVTVNVAVKDDGSGSDENSRITGGIATVTYQIDNGTEETVSDKGFDSSMVTSCDFNADISGAGEHTLSVTAIDHAGNENQQQVIVKISEKQEQPVNIVGNTEIQPTGLVQPDLPQNPGSTPKNTDAAPQNTDSAPKNTEPNTGDSTHVEIYATIAMVAGLTYLLLYFTTGEHGMTEERKKELVFQLLQWAKEGGRIRRMLAFTAIFFLLIYYHSIGKHLAVEWKEAYGE